MTKGRAQAAGNMQPRARSKQGSAASTHERDEGGGGGWCGGWARAAHHAMQCRAGAVSLAQSTGPRRGR